MEMSTYVDEKDAVEGEEVIQSKEVQSKFYNKKIFALLRYQDSSTDVENVYHEEKQADGEHNESKKVISL